jgi:hypothetical protein
MYEGLEVKCLNALRRGAGYGVPDSSREFIGWLNKIIDQHHSESAQESEMRTVKKRVSVFIDLIACDTENLYRDTARKDPGVRIFVLQVLRGGRER